MVIVRRALYAWVQKREDTRQKAAQAKKEAARKRVKQQAADPTNEDVAAEKAKIQEVRQRKKWPNMAKKKGQIRKLEKRKIQDTKKEEGKELENKRGCDLETTAYQKVGGYQCKANDEAENELDAKGNEIKKPKDSLCKRRDSEED